MEEWTPELDHWLKQQAQAVGFHAAAIATLDAPGTAAGSPDAQRFSQWIDSGFAGEMEYLKRRDQQGTLLRSHVQAAMPWARSVIVCALDYNTPAPASIDPAPPTSGWIARYAWTGRDPGPSTGSEASPRTLQPTDYHHQLLSRLRRIESAILERVPCQTRCYVDTGPLAERSLAAHAGIGWIGKNTCVLNQQLGSWLLLGVIVTSLPVAPATPLQIAADRCGSCTRCIDACPTSALIAPRQMDASLCIAYLTIEKKGPIPEPLRQPMGRQVFGCDICQDVCPWNDRAQNHRAQNHRSPIYQPQDIRPHPPEGIFPSHTEPSQTEGMLPREELINPSLEWLAAMDNPAFKKHFKNSPLERTGRKRLHRNVAIAMGNSRDTRHLPRLRTWAAADEDPFLAETAAWAILQIEAPLSSSNP